MLKATKQWSKQMSGAGFALPTPGYSDKENNANCSDLPGDFSSE